jgi:hypothetical protein
MVLLFVLASVITRSQMTIASPSGFSFLVSMRAETIPDSRQRFKQKAAPCPNRMYLKRG